ncbi:MAG TPA: hypothetical protein PK668_17885 [Myxococcota bacterium]|nr:hypothetical protein [Myxococcota bacterium]HRY95833.1 hypothetical protein [Myxococcota bacterium]
MGLVDMARLLGLLRRLARAPEGGGPDPRVEEQRARRTSAGMPYDLLLPRHQPEAVLIALHGATLNGKDDARLQHFARQLAVSGAACAVPNLPGMSRLEWLPSDLEALAGLIGELHAETGHRVGLVGFSFAAAYALVVATRPEVAERVRFVLSIGAYHSFPELYQHFLRTRHDPAEDEAAEDDLIYRDAIGAWRQRAALGLDPARLAELEALLRRFCHQASPEEKRAFRERWLLPRDPVALDVAAQDRAALEALSPAGKLAGLRCPVSLIHDPHDHIIPVSHARALEAELGALPDGGRHRVLVTGLLKHVTLSGAFNLGEAARLLAALQPLVQT